MAHFLNLNCGGVASSSLYVCKAPDDSESHSGWRCCLLPGLPCSLHCPGVPSPAGDRGPAQSLSISIFPAIFTCFLYAPCSRKSAQQTKTLLGMISISSCLCSFWIFQPPSKALGGEDRLLKRTWDRDAGFVPNFAINDSSVYPWTWFDSWFFIWNICYLIFTTLKYLSVPHQLKFWVLLISVFMILVSQRKLGIYQMPSWHLLG